MQSPWIRAGMVALALFAPVLIALACICAGSTTAGADCCLPTETCPCCPSHGPGSGADAAPAMDCAGVCDLQPVQVAAAETVLGLADPAHEDAQILVGTDEPAPAPQRTGGSDRAVARTCGHTLLHLRLRTLRC